MSTRTARTAWNGGVGTYEKNVPKLGPDPTGGCAGSSTNNTITLDASLE